MRRPSRTAVRDEARSQSEGGKRDQMPERLRIPVVENFFSATEIARAEVAHEADPYAGDPVLTLMVSARRQFLVERSRWARANGIDPDTFPPVLAPHWREEVDALSSAERAALEERYTRRVPRGSWLTGHESELLDRDGRVIEKKGA